MALREHRSEIKNSGLERFGRLAKWLPRESLWRLSGEYRASDAISFPLDAIKLQDLEIRWPKTYDWPHAGRYVEDIAAGLNRLAVMKSAEIPQAPGVAMVQVLWRDKLFHVAIDYSDYLDRIDAEALKKCALYFKMQYRRQGYDSITKDARKIVPGGYVNGHPEIYHYLPHIRKAAKRNGDGYDVFGRFALDFAKDVRQKAVELLQGQSDFHYGGGLKKVRYSCSLLEAAQSKICIDLPSNSDFCFRLVDYFAVGACVIGPRHRTEMHVGLQEHKHIVYTKDDLSDLIPLCKYYLENNAEREEIKRNARQYFDRYLHREQLAAYYIHQCIKYLTGKGDTLCGS